MYDDTFETGIIAFALTMLALTLFLLALRPDEAEPGLTQKWKCSDEMTMIVDIPDDGIGPVEGYHCERVPAGAKD